jgi:hypothetical protein
MSEVLIILTTTVNVNRNKQFLFQTSTQDRVNTYIKSISQWLEKTNFKICVVENSGYAFTELDEYKEKYSDRFDVIGFSEETLPDNLKHLYYNISKGAGEMYSVIHAYNNTKFKESTRFVIKITGRYFIDTFEEFILSNNISDKVGIGKINPLQALDILGNLNLTGIFYVQPSSFFSCDISSEGALYYNISLHKHFGCNGTSWNALY